MEEGKEHEKGGRMLSLLKFVLPCFCFHRMKKHHHLWS